MFALMLPRKNDFNGWHYAGNITITFLEAVSSLERKLIETFLKDIEGFSFEGNCLHCSQKSIFGADYGILGEGIMFGSIQGSNLHPFLALRYVKEITNENNRRLWPLKTKTT